MALSFWGRKNQPKFQNDLTRPEEQMTFNMHKCTWICSMKNSPNSIHRVVGPELTITTQEQHVWAVIASIMKTLAQLLDSDENQNKQTIKHMNWDVQELSGRGWGRKFCHSGDKPMAVA